MVGVSSVLFLPSLVIDDFNEIYVTVCSLLCYVYLLFWLFPILFARA